MHSETEIRSRSPVAFVPIDLSSHQQRARVAPALDETAPRRDAVHEALVVGLGDPGSIHVMVAHMVLIVGVTLYSEEIEGMLPSLSWNDVERVEAMLIMMQDMIDLAGHYAWRTPGYLEDP